MFRPAPQLTEWLMATFIAEGAPLLNEDHAHLRQAKLGCLWTNVPNARHGRSIVGQCEIMPPAGAMGRWQKARMLDQIEGWFGSLPDFVLTFDAVFADEADDATFMALVEHECLHAGQEIDPYGVPKFSKTTGLPVFAVKAHDFEGFIGIARRYGPVEAGAREMLEALSKSPTIGRAQINAACGTCLRVAA